ncbi:CRISPR-associated endonuclease Cas1 [Leptolyngbya sp. AN03gr2]|uniref:CRISPR-associated endonuclease Cas1 n=1 Tax=unclassified Leptolyngbya TaxID=2650499 RepID=UPI003D313A98
MKADWSLKPRILEQQLWIAWELVQQRSPAAGIDGITVELFAGVVEEQMRSLYKQLRSQTYEASPAKGFYLAKKDGGKRLVGISTVRDRILQRYLLQAIYPKLDQALSEVAYAYRPGYSTHQAVERVAEMYQSQPVWVLKTDIEKFFDRICWAVLIAELERLGLAPIMLRWIEQQLKAGMVIDRQFVRMNQGVLQGGVLSGALANLYLREFDRRCLEAGLPLVRYGDDCLVVCGSWIGANRALSLMQGWLEESFLTLQPEKTQIFAPDESFVFLGYRFAVGQVEAPERAIKSEGTKPRAAKSGGRPPKACSIVKTPRVQRTGSTDVYWSEPMTTLYVTDQGAYVRVQNKQFQVFHRDELKISVPVNRVTHIVLFGCSNLSHGAVSLCLLHKIPVLYLSSNGKYFGQLQTTGQAQVRYLIYQVQRSFDEEFILRQAKAIVLAKLHNSRVLLMRLNRRRKTEVATSAIAQLTELIALAELAESVEGLLGYEGQGASLYFPAFGSLLKGEWDFERRTRRPPTDPVNSLLSLGYTLLSQNLHSMVEVSGLHTHFGNLHVPRDNHAALVSDLIEEFRSLVVDSLVAYLVNKRVLVPEDFTPPDERGGVYLHPDGLKRFLTQWEKRLQTQISHPNSGLKVNHRRCFELQVWEYIRCLTGEQEMYRPMRWKE